MSFGSSFRQAIRLKNPQIAQIPQTSRIRNLQFAIDCGARLGENQAQRGEVSESGIFNLRSAWREAEENRGKLLESGIFNSQSE
jgi:hypothetical protein